MDRKIAFAFLFVILQVTTVSAGWGSLLRVETKAILGTLALRRRTWNENKASQQITPEMEEKLDAEMEKLMQQLAEDQQ
uniref:Uncharacterized LOC100185302 n=1 Tax=Ciona intestinalis TaxID=7719 RepID=F6VGX8_CIOIN